MFEDGGGKGISVSNERKINICEDIPDSNLKPSVAGTQAPDPHPPEPLASGARPDPSQGTIDPLPASQRLCFFTVTRLPVVVCLSLMHTEQVLKLPLPIKPRSSFPCRSRNGAAQRTPYLDAPSGISRPLCYQQTWISLALSSTDVKYPAPLQFTSEMVLSAES